MTGCGGIPGNSYNANQIRCTPATVHAGHDQRMDTVIGKVLDVVDSSVPTPTSSSSATTALGPTVMDNMYITTTGRGKTTPYESGARVPMAIRGPGIAAGSESSESVHAADLFATFLTLAGSRSRRRDLFTRTIRATLPIRRRVPDPDSFRLRLHRARPERRLPPDGSGYWSGNKVGARNATYKVICNTNTSNKPIVRSTTLITDPLEEYPLTKPTSCTNYDKGRGQRPTRSGTIAG